MSSRQLKSGLQFGRWTLTSKIGQGGNGVVWEAQGEDGQHAALKFLKSHNLEPSEDPEEQAQRERRYQRFLDEVQFMQSHLGRPGILPLIDLHVPQVRTPKDRPWFATPVAVSLPRAATTYDYHLVNIVRIIAIVARTLVVLHAESKFHRDIKPNNILLLGEDPLLGDFGLVDFPGKPAVTEAREILGPLFYVAPEMMSNAADINPAPADVYSLAKTLWVTATGQVYPLPGEQRSNVPALTLSAYVADPRARVLDAVLDDATRHDPACRPSMSRFADELESWGKTLPQVYSIDEQIKEIGREFAPVQAGYQDARDREKRRVDDARALLEHVATQLSPLLPALEQLQLLDFSGCNLAPRLITGEGHLSYWHISEWPKAAFPLAGTPVWIGRAEIHQQACGLKGRSFAYCGGLRFALYEQGHLRMTAAHAFGSINADLRECHDVSWSQEANITVGYPSAEVEANNVVGEFRTHFPAAISAFLQLFERMGGIPPP